MEIKVKISSPRLRSLLAYVLPTERQLDSLLSELKEKVQQRIFPSEGAGHTPEGKPYRPYGIYTLYVPVDASPPPKGTITKGGAGRTVKFRHGWGGGPESYRASLGLSIESDVNLTFTGKTKAGLRCVALSDREGIIFFDGDQEETLAEILNARYEFWGLSQEEIEFFSSRLEQLLEKILAEFFMEDVIS